MLIISVLKEEKINIAYLLCMENANQVKKHEVRNLILGSNPIHSTWDLRLGTKYQEVIILDVT